ncbi:TetR family transcriptional regulator [Sphaerisporangium krabiense]|nr:TetR family transcriptional regulator [Sphaerisporangium krabiense]
MGRSDDRDIRRRQIAAALLRVAGAKGLHAATMRAVAAEAGVSLHLVQHYFETKEQLMLFALRHLAERMATRIKEDLGALGAAPAPRQVIETVLTRALPTDEESRVFHLVYTSYAMLAVTDAALRHQPFLAAPDAMERFVAEQVRLAQESGDMPRGVDPALTAAALVAMSAGLGTSVLLGQRSAEDALTVIRQTLGGPAPDAATGA